MSILDNKHILTINLDDRTIRTKSNIRFYNTDRNIANLYIKLEKTNSEEVTIDLTETDLIGLKLKLTVIKPKTNEFREITGVLTKELQEYTCAIYKFELPLEFTDQYGIVYSQFDLTDGLENGENITIDPFSYEVKASKLTGLNAEIIPSPDLPILKQLIEEMKKAQQWITNIDDVKSSEVKTYSSKKIEDIKSKIDEQFNTKANQSLAVKKVGKNIQIAYKYNAEKDCRIRINDINANGTPQLCGNEFFTNTNILPSLNFEIVGDSFNIGKTDFIGPIICQAVLNSDTDVNVDGSLHFTGGMHDINDTIGTGKPTATNISMKTYIDGFLHDENASVATRANNIKIIVQNKIMASNTVKLDGSGRYVLSEIVTYEIGTDLKLNVKVSLEPLEDINIYKYYGFQGNFLGYKESYTWSQVNFIMDNDVTLPVTLGQNTVSAADKICKSIIIDNRYGNIVKMNLKNVGLGTFFLNKNSSSALCSNWSKCYFNLIRYDDTPFLLKRTRMLFWEGSYEFTEGKCSII